MHKNDLYRCWTDIEGIFMLKVVNIVLSNIGVIHIYDINYHDTQTLSQNFVIIDTTSMEYHLGVHLN